ncbi:SufE family protein [Spiribacter vilamensis]|uniref:Cysteine desulfuration protein SufE n=1 Tax=Spiribacter vilamensis TaxID=531306 RepID=A0A4Q8CZ69_9GAMM|nr:SufE family protein [Spiribacter vilamensis]RZU98316.1 cysteine desulfuration protein SufE [Spiribacter vilamensis]TVO60795.1 SufE family protein [Spiribacter vilamensis]
MDLQRLIDTFNFLDNWEDRYRLLIDMGRELPALPDEARVEANRVDGCTSNVWLETTVSDETPPRMHFTADSDAFIVKGLVAILLKAYSGKTPQEILDTDIESLFDDLGLSQQLTANRRDGFVAMVKQVRNRAQAIQSGGTAATAD